MNWIFIGDTVGKNKQVTLNLPHAYTTHYVCFKTLGVAADTANATYRSVGCRAETLSTLYVLLIDNAEIYFFTIGY